MKETIISAETIINASKQQVWEVISDIGNICQASPGVLSSHLTSETKSGVGTSRHCDFAMMGASAEEKVTQWEEGVSFKIEAFELKKLPGMKTMGAKFVIKEAGEKTILNASLSYSMKNFIFEIMNASMMKKMNTRSWQGVIAGYKHFIETGQEVNQKTKIDYLSVKIS